MNLEFLKELGLSKGEVKVYEAMLSAGPCQLSVIHEKTGIERRNIYDILNKLIEKGLATYSVENKKRTFSVSNPQKILSSIQEKKQGLEKTEATVMKSLPELMRAFDSKSPAISFEIFKGVEGMKAVWNDMLNYSDIYLIGVGRYVPKRFPAFFKHWNNKRIAKGIMLYNLLRHELSETPIFRLEEARFLPKEFSANPVVLSITRDKVTTYFYGEEPCFFVIKSKEIAENYLRYFRFLWKKSAKP